MAVQDKICPYHYEHHSSIEKMGTDIEKLYSKVNTVEKSYIKYDTDIPSQIKELKNKFESFQSCISKKLLHIRYRAYVTATTSGIIGAIAIKALELLWKLITK